MTTSCQICGREIKAKNGLIAHHGYKRPYKSGWQTDSCLGAMFPPYEISHDRIPFVMNLLTKFLKANELKLNELICHPPEKMHTVIGGAYARKTIEVTRPIDFDVNTFRHGVYIPNSYDNVFSKRQHELKQIIKEAQKEHDFLKERWQKK